MVDVVSQLVFLSVAIIDVELLGFLYYVGLEYNSVTAVNIVLSMYVRHTPRPRVANLSHPHTDSCLVASTAG